MFAHTKFMGTYQVKNGLSNSYIPSAREVSDLKVKGT